MSNALYAAAPRGIRLAGVVSDAGILRAMWEGWANETRLYGNFSDAFDEAMELSWGGPYAFEVVTFLPRGGASGGYGLVGYSGLLASYGVAYKMVDYDELEAQLAEDEEALRG